MSKSITQKCRAGNSEDKCTLNKNGEMNTIKGLCSKHYNRLKRNNSTNKNDLLFFQEGQSKHKLYKTHAKMKERCYNINNDAYLRYGGRGITVCDRWLGNKGFWNFVSDMGERPEGYTLDRIDNNKGYSPENCRWASWHKQAANRNNNNKIVGVYYCKQKLAYISRLNVNGMTVLNKTFKTYKEALLSRKEAEKKYNIKEAIQ